MKAKIYLETSFISYFTVRLSRDLITAAHQQITHEWWETRSRKYELYISQLIIDEASKGDSEASQKRVEFLSKIPILKLNEEVYQLAQDFISRKIIPSKYIDDAFHISFATIHGMDYLLTWNCKHIANAEMRNKIEEICRTNGYINPIICTPEELMGK